MVFIALHLYLSFLLFSASTMMLFLSINTPLLADILIGIFCNFLSGKAFLDEIVILQSEIIMDIQPQCSFIRLTTKEMTRKFQSFSKISKITVFKNSNLKGIQIAWIFKSFVC